MMPEDLWKELGGFLGLAEEEGLLDEPVGCAACGRPFRPGEPHRLRQDGRLEHVMCPNSLASR